MVTHNIFLYNVVFVDEIIAGEVPIRNVEENENTVHFLRYNKSKKWVNNSKTVFRSVNALIATCFSTEPMI